MSYKMSKSEAAVEWTRRLKTKEWLDPKGVPEWQDGNSCVGKRIWVFAEGEAVVKSFLKVAKWRGTSTHMLQFDSGDKKELKLLRKGNGKKAWLVNLPKEVPKAAPPARAVSPGGRAAAEPEAEGDDEVGATLRWLKVAVAGAAVLAAHLKEYPQRRDEEAKLEWARSRGADTGGWETVKTPETWLGDGQGAYWTNDGGNTITFTNPSDTE